jgi:Tfp pilus assembly protein FimT
VGVVKRTPILLFLAIIGLACGIAIPGSLQARRRTALQSAADDVRTTLLLARMRAAERGRDAGIRFVRIDGVWHHILYDDGNATDRAATTSRAVDPPAARRIRCSHRAPSPWSTSTIRSLCVHAGRQRESVRHRDRG